MVDHDVARTTAGSSTETDPSESAHQTHPHTGRHSAAGAAAVSRIADAPSSPTLKVGGGAFLTTAQVVRFADETEGMTLVPSTYVEIVSMAGGHATVRVYSLYGGKTATVPTSALRAEPRMGLGEGAQATTPRDDSYTLQHGPLWIGAPKIDDVRQGYLGDCYLCAAMGAVVAANPNAIRSMFSPTTPDAPKYSIALHRRAPDGHFMRHVEVVDAYLPTDQTGVAYADNGRTPTDKTMALWPALIEKAYSQMIGGYDVAGQGGSSTSAMEALTGVAGDEQAVPSSDKELLTMLRGMQGKLAMAAGSLPPQQVTAKGGFTQDEKGHYSVQLSAPGGTQPELLPNTVSVAAPPPTPSRLASPEQSAAAAPSRVGYTGGASLDPSRPTLTASDDGSGALKGDGMNGTVAYGTGAAKVALDANVAPPDSAADLSIAYTWEGLLDDQLTVYASHAYIFESVTPDGLIQLRNPWGVQHPAPMTPADFRRLFVTLYDDKVPQIGEPPRARKSS